MRVGFLSNQLDNRGTGNALFEYAYYNERLLGNTSIIYTYGGGNHDSAAYDRFRDYFPVVLDPSYDTKNVDVMYHIKSGEFDGITFPNTKYAVHAVFNASHPHGDRYAAVSEWLGARDGAPWVPHIVTLPYHKQGLRQELKIPDDAIVFGRHGGLDTFDISWVWEAIKWVLGCTKNIYFLFMNTAQPDFINDPRVIFLEPTISEVQKRKFINTCDAMIHARMRGETFGLAVGEFAVAGKPVLTYSGSGERAHLVELERAGHQKFFYADQMDVFNQLRYFKKQEAFAYTQFLPEYVMKKFKEVFLDGH